MAWLSHIIVPLERGVIVMAITTFLLATLLTANLIYPPMESSEVLIDNGQTCAQECIHSQSYIEEEIESSCPLDPNPSVDIESYIIDDGTDYPWFDIDGYLYGHGYTFYVDSSDMGEFKGYAIKPGERIIVLTAGYPVNMSSHGTPIGIIGKDENGTVRPIFACDVETITGNAIRTNYGNIFFFDDTIETFRDAVENEDLMQDNPFDGMVYIEFKGGN